MPWVAPSQPCRFLLPLSCCSPATTLCESGVLRAGAQAAVQLCMAWAPHVMHWAGPASAAPASLTACLCTCCCHAELHGAVAAARIPLVAHQHACAAVLASVGPSAPFPYRSYTPLLPAMCAGTVEERSIVEPVRAVLGGKVRTWQLCVSPRDVPCAWARLHGPCARCWDASCIAAVLVRQWLACSLPTSSQRCPLRIPQGKFFEAKCTDIMPEEKTIVACFPGGCLVLSCSKALFNLVLGSHAWKKTIVACFPGGCCLSTWMSCLVPVSTGGWHAAWRGDRHGPLPKQA